MGKKYEWFWNSAFKLYHCNQIFTVQNRSSAALTNNLTVSGTDSKLIIGDGVNPINFTIPSSFNLTASVDVSNNAALTITNSLNPVFDDLSSGSSVIYNYSGN